MLRMNRLCIVTVVSVLVICGVHETRGAVTGTVRGTSGISLSGITVTLAGEGVVDTTDSLGNYEIVPTTVGKTRVLPVSDARVHINGRDVGLYSSTSQKVCLRLVTLQGRQMWAFQGTAHRGFSRLPGALSPTRQVCILQGTVGDIRFSRRLVSGHSTIQSVSRGFSQSLSLARTVDGPALDTLVVWAPGYQEYAVPVTSTDCTLDIVLPAIRNIDSASVDSLINSPAWATVKTDLTKSFFEPDIPVAHEMVYAVLVRYEQLLLDIHNAAVSMTWEDVRFALDDILEQYFPQDAYRKEMLARVAMVVYLARAGGLAWDFGDLDPEFQQLVYHTSAGMSGGIDEKFVRFEVGDFTFPLDEAAPNISASFTFGGYYLLTPIARAITRGAQTPVQAVEKLTAWMENNVFHTYTNSFENEDWTDALYENDPRVDSMFGSGFLDYAYVVEERAMGCPKAARLLAALSTSIGIPSFSSQYEHGGFGHHSVTVYPSLEIIVHGDFMADNFGMPTEPLVLTFSEFDSVMIAWEHNNTNYCEQLEIDYERELVLTRKDSTLHVNGYVHVCPDEKDSVLAEFLLWDVPLNCVSITGSDCERCEVEDVSLPIKDMLTLLKENPM